MQCSKISIHLRRLAQNNLHNVDPYNILFVVAWVIKEIVITLYLVCYNIVTSQVKHISDVMPDRADDAHASGYKSATPSLL